MLCNRLIEKGDKAEPATSIGVRVPDNLTIFHSSKIALKETRKLILFQFVIQTANKDFVPSNLHRARAITAASILL